MGVFSFLNIFKKKEKIQKLDGGINVNVMRGFLEQIEDTICIANVQGDIEYINNPSMLDKYKTLRDLLEYKENKSTYSKIISTALDEGAFIGDIELNKNDVKIGMYIACYYTRSCRKICYIYKRYEQIFRTRVNTKRRINKTKGIYKVKRFIDCKSFP